MNNQTELPLNEPKPSTMKYRGQGINDGKWYHGYFVAHSGRFGPIPSIYMYDDLIGEDAYFQVDNRTVNQFTGRCDMNGTEIYGGDIVEGGLSFKGGALPTMGVVEYDYTFAAFGLKNQGGLTLFHNHALNSFKVIGNIHDNPELIQE